MSGLMQHAFHALHHSHTGRVILHHAIHDVRLVRGYALHTVRDLHVGRESWRVMVPFWTVALVAAIVARMLF